MIDFRVRKLYSTVWYSAVQLKKRRLSCRIVILDCIVLHWFVLYCACCIMYGVKDIVSYGVVTEIVCVCTRVRANVCVLMYLEPSIDLKRLLIIMSV